MTTDSKLRTYSDLRSLSTLEDRFDYLKLSGSVGATTFGYDRWMNQQFYRSAEWRHIRDEVMARDEFDLGVPGMNIRGYPVIHHMNPLSVADISDSSDNLMNPEFLITTCLRTHNAIHYGDKKLLPQPFVERRPGDTRLWGNT